MTSSTRRLLKEATDLQKNPSPHFTASPISDSSLHDWHFTLTGPPPPSPFSSGIYHGRITFPPTYPLRPPSFRFLTPSGRFEVNREICLSISGHHEESWQPAWGVRTALLAIRSYMDVDARGQVGGLEMGEGGRRELARESRGWRCAVEGCNGGRSNEGVIREWREGVCRDRGVVDEEESATGGEEGEQVQSETREGDAHALAQEPAAEPAEPVLEEPREPSQRQPQQQQVSPVPAQYQPQTVPTTTTDTPSNQDSPWLDRAIIGILIALVVMVLRRLSRDDDEEF